MRKAFVLNRLVCLSIVSTIFLIAAPTLWAQSAAIQPCEQAPAPKPGTTTTPVKVAAKASQTVIDSSIPEDPELLKLLAPYSEKVRELSIVIGTLDEKLTKTNVGAGSIGHLVTDAMLAAARSKSTKLVAVAITNAGGLRKNDISAGQLRASDIFELLPFENALITLDLTGEQLKKITQAGTRDAQAGLQVEYRWNDQNRTEVLSVKLLDDKGAAHEIDPKAIYTIVTIDYLYNLKSGAYAVFQDAKNMVPLNLTMRDAVTNYIKAETSAGRHIKSTLDKRFVQIGPGPTKEEAPPQ
ncbi:MAG TPA: 5'-nucleotidase C-terminal domain-containing protein [Pyrinomonadaceae bacterium]